MFDQSDGVSGLRENDPVKVSGVPVGQVQSIDLLDASLVKVTFTANNNQRLTTQTWALVRYANLLGNRYLALTQSGKAGQKLKIGATIPATRTKPALSLTALFNGFRPLFAALTPDQVNELSNDIIGILQGQSGKLDDLITRTASLTSTLAARDQVFAQVVDSLSSLLQTVSQHDDQLATMLQALQALTTELHADGPALLNSLSSVDGLASSVSGMLRGLENHNITGDLADLEHVSGVFASNTGTLQKLIASFNVAFGDFARITQNGGYINTFPCKLAFILKGNTQVSPAGLLTSVGNSLPGGLGTLLSKLGLSSLALLQLQIQTPLKLPPGDVGRAGNTKVCR
jgi:phospholipid/cholesterol/gamma-HCH transport system substrate-binding protein